MRIFFGRRKYTSVLWANMLLMVTILSMIGIMICNFFYESSMQKTIDKNLQSVKLLRNEIDNQIAGMEATTRSLRRDYDVLMALAEGGGYRDYKIVSELASRTAANVNLVDIVLYDFEKNKAYCSSGTIEAEKYFGTYTQSSVSTKELTRQIRTTEVPVLNGILPISIYRESERKDVAFYMTPFSFQRKLVYLIRKDAFVKPVKAVIGNQQASFYIMDASHGSELALNVNTDLPSVPDFKNYTEERTWDGISMGFSGRYILLFSNSSVSGFQYCIVSRASLFHREFHTLRSVLITSFMGFLLVGLILSYICTQMSYRPIALLTNDVPVSAGTGVSTGYEDLDVIRNHLSDMQEKLQETNCRLLSDRNLLKSSLINALVRSTSVYSTNYDSYVREGILFPYILFTVLVANMPDKGGPVKDRYVPFYKWEDSGNRSVAYLSGKNEYDLLIVLFHADTESGLVHAEGQFCEKVRQLDSSCRIGIGKPVKSAHRIRQSFLQALSALAETESGENRPAMHYDPHIQRIIDLLDYVNMEKPKLTQAIQQCRMEEVESLLQAIFQSTEDHIHHILIYSDLISHLILIASSVNFYDEEMNNAVYHVYSDRRSMMDCYLFYAGRLCCHIWKMKEDQSSQLLREVASYIEENFADRNLSVQGIADYFHVSTSYLNKYMRKAGKDTVFQMLDKVRMEHAKKMLLEGSAPLKDIVHCCGYGDINHFTKKFKKQTGWTPTQFRSGKASVSKV